MQPVRDWTVLVYMNSNNNLANGAKGLLRHQLGDLEPSDRVSVAVEYSHLRGDPNYIWPDAVTHRRCEVQSHGLKTVEERPYENMAAPETLESFLRWGIRNYPAKRYAVVVQGHGSAWRNALPDEATRFDAQGRPLPKAGSPQEDSRPATLSVPALRQVLEKVEADTGVVPEVLAFDSCLMANLEAAYELKDRAGVLVGSEDVVTSPAWQKSEHSLDFAAPLKGILQKLSERVDAGQDVDGPTLARDWVDGCRRTWTTPTQTALDLKAVPAVAAAADRLAEALSGADEDALRDLTARSRHFAEPGDRYAREWDSKRHLYDLVDLAERVQLHPRLQAAHGAAAEVAEAVRSARLAHEAQEQLDCVWRFSYGQESHGRESYPADRTHGLSIYLPDTPVIVERAEKDGHDYGALRFARDTRWPRLIHRLAAP